MTEDIGEGGGNDNFGAGKKFVAFSIAAALCAGRGGRGGQESLPVGFERVAGGYFILSREEKAMQGGDSLMGDEETCLSHPSRPGISRNRGQTDETEKRL